MLIRFYDKTNREVLKLKTTNMVNALAMVELEIWEFGNPLQVVRIDVYDMAGFALRINA